MSVCVYNTKRINLLHNNILNTSPCAAILHKIFHRGEKKPTHSFFIFWEKRMSSLSLEVEEEKKQFVPFFTECIYLIMLHIQILSVLSGSSFFRGKTACGLLTTSKEEEDWFSSPWWQVPYDTHKKCSHASLFTHTLRVKRRHEPFSQNICTATLRICHTA